MGTGAQKVESAGDPEAAKDALAEAIENIEQLLREAGIDDPDELAKAEEVYNGVLQFLENTGFNPNLLPPHKY